MRLNYFEFHGVGDGRPESIPETRSFYRGDAKYVQYVYDISPGVLRFLSREPYFHCGSYLFLTALTDGGGAGVRWRLLVNGEPTADNALKVKTLPALASPAEKPWFKLLAFYATPLIFDNKEHLRKSLAETFGKVGISGFLAPRPSQLKAFEGMDWWVFQQFPESFPWLPRLDSSNGIIDTKGQRREGADGVWEDYCPEFLMQCRNKPTWPSSRSTCRPRGILSSRGSTSTMNPIGTSRWTSIASAGDAGPLSPSP